MNDEEKVVLNLWGTDIRGLDYISKTMGEIVNENARKILDMIDVLLPVHNDKDSVHLFYVLNRRTGFEINRRGTQSKTQVDIYIQFETNEHTHADDIPKIGVIMKELDFWGECHIAHWDGWSEGLVICMGDVDDHIIGASFLVGDVPTEWLPTHHKMTALYAETEEGLR